MTLNPDDDDEVVDGEIVDDEGPGPAWPPGGSRRPAAFDWATEQVATQMYQKVVPVALERGDLVWKTGEELILKTRAAFQGLALRQAAAATHLIDMVANLRIAVEREHDTRRDGGRTMERRTVPSMLLAVATVVAFLVVWRIDSTLLQRPFADEPIGTVTIISLLVAVAQTVTAHVVGAFRKHLAYERGVRDLQRQVWAQWAAICFIAAMTSEAVLGLIRLGRTGQVLSTLLLILAGLAFWFGVAALAYGHASANVVTVFGERLPHWSAIRVHQSRTNDMNKARKTVTASQDALIEGLAGVVEYWDDEAALTRADFERDNPGLAAPPIPDPPQIAKWRGLKRIEDLPRHLQVPDIEPRDVTEAYTTIKSFSIPPLRQPRYEIDQSSGDHAAGR